MAAAIIQRILGIGILIFLYGLLMSYLQMPFYRQLVMGGEISIASCQLTRTFILKPSEPIEKISLSFLSGFFLFRALSGFETTTHYSSTLAFILICLFFVTGFFWLAKSDLKSFTWKTYLLASAFGMYTLALLFKAMHVQGAQVLLISAVILAAIWSLFSFILFGKKGS